MPSNPILICAREANLRTELESALADAGYATTSVGSPADAVAAMRGRRFDLIVAEGLAASGAIASLRTASADGITPILVVSPAHDVEAQIAFLEAGADDVIVDGFANSELEGRVMAQLIRAGKVQPESGVAHRQRGDRGLLQPEGRSRHDDAGGEYRRPAGRRWRSDAGAGTRDGAGGFPAARVLLVDLDLQFGQVATHLNLTPRYDIGGLASDEQALADPELARMYLTTHSSGLIVLAAPTRPEADFRVTLEHLERIFEMLAPSFDHIIVDLGSRLDPRAVWLLEQSDAHVFVLFPEIAALRAMSMLMTFLAETTPLQARAAIVVNHVFPKELLKTRDVENLLRMKPAAEIPYTEVEMIRSVNEGVPLVIGRPSSPATVALRRVAQAVIGIEQHQAAPKKKAERRSIFSRRR